MGLQILSDRIQEEIRDAIISLVRSVCEKVVDSTTPRYLNQKEAIKYLHTSAVTFGDWVKNRDLPEIRISGTIRYDRKDLDKFMLNFKD